MGRRKKTSQRDEDSNANADQIPERYRELVQNLNAIFQNRSEREIYLTLVECNMKYDFATQRLLAEGKDIESKIVKNLKKLVNCSEEKIEQVLLECNIDPNEAFNRLLSQDHILEDKREIVEKLINIVNGSGQEIYEVLFECNMNAEEAVNSLLSQGSGNKFNSDGNETSNVQEIHNHLAVSSTTSDNLGSEPPLNSDVSDGNTNKVPISLSEAVSSLSVPSSLGHGGKGKRIMGLAPEKPNVPKAFRSLPVSRSLRFADVLKMGLANENENVTKALPTLVAPEEQSLQRQSIYTFVDFMRQQGPSDDLQNLTTPLNQSMPSVSSLTEMNEEAISHHYSQPQVPFTVNPYGSAQGSTNSSAHSSTYPSPIGSTYGSTYSSAHGSVYGSPSGAASGFSLWSDKAADLILESDDDLISKHVKNLASYFPKSHDQNHQSPSVMPIQPQQQQIHQSPSVMPIQPQQQQIHQSPSFMSIQPQQQQIHQSPSFMPNQPQQQQIHKSPSFMPIQPQQQQQQHQIHQSPSFIPNQPQQQQIHKSPSFMPIQPQQQHQIHQSPSFIPNQPQQQQQQHWNHQSPSFIHNQPQQLLQQHQNQFRSFPPQQLQHQNQFRSFPPLQLQHQNHHLTYMPPLQQQQLQYHRRPSFEHIQQLQQEQQLLLYHRPPSFEHTLRLLQQELQIHQQQRQQENNRTDPSKQTQKEQWPRNNYK